MLDAPLEFTAWLIVFARVGAMAMVLPGFSEDALPGRVRLLLGIGLSIGVAGMVHARAVAVARGDAGLVAVLLAELLTGLALGLIVRLLYQAINIFGGIASMQVGLGSTLIVDPAQGGQVPLLGRIAALAALITCFAAQLHHLWIGALLHSYVTFPVGGMPPPADLARLAVSSAGATMRIALSLSAPLLLYGIAFNVALGLAGRMAPMLQLFFITQPLNLLLGLALFATTAGVVITGFTAAMGGAMRDSGLI